MIGALIFAFNNDDIDYVSMAAWSANNIRRHLNIPVAIVTDKPTDYKFDQVIICDAPGSNARWFGDYNKNVRWRNESRVNAYELSPWSTTLVLDADYIVASDQLKVLFSADQDFLCHRWAYDITGLTTFEDLNYFGNHKMPMHWATVMMFRKSLQSKLIFDSMNMIQQNWKHFRDLYKNSITSYRNDHALSIALGIVNGHTIDHPSIPWNLASLTPDHKLTQLGPDDYRVDFLTHDLKSKWIKITNQDFHAMGKQQLEIIVANSR